ncbi:PREDICTED: uncharacterized protein LOC109114621 [Nelumbo nucifera]|uniref:Uncharacterized protein LOC109114621 n=1 Tax=Nelumbo nucifera TaxID=4432 RepID=A0A1U8Q4Z0_NELNU|nr:PREDICTED: uncharacterized protein LOC109114621 [Nelumbo nucifera]
METKSFKSAGKQEVWVKAMKEEFAMIEKNKTWELVDHPQDKEVIGVKWVYTTKLNSDVSIQKHKVMLVAKDDLICTGNNETMIKEFKENMMKTFEMIDLGLMHYFLGIKINQEEKGIFISQKKYIENLLKKFKMERCKTVATPLVTNERFKKEIDSKKADASIYKSLIGSLLYLTATWPNIMYATSLFSRFMQIPS